MSIGRAMYARLKPSSNWPGRDAAHWTLPRGGMFARPTPVERRAAPRTGRAGVAPAWVPRRSHDLRGCHRLPVLGGDGVLHVPGPAGARDDQAMGAERGAG